MSSDELSQGVEQLEEELEELAAEWEKHASHYDNREKDTLTLAAKRMRSARRRFGR